MNSYEKNFWIRVSQTHGNRYNYALSVYTGVGNKITIICTEHGQFNQRASNHAGGQGCPKCAIALMARGKLGKRSPRRMTQDKFKEAVVSIHSDNLDLSKAIYDGYHTNVMIVCNRNIEHGTFEKTPSSLISKQRGCPLCTTGYYPKQTVDEFLVRVNSIHGDRYSYELGDVTHVGSGDTIVINCSVHGKFSQNAREHYNGANCSDCVGGVIKPYEYYLDRFIKIHGDRYKYSHNSFINSKSRMTIICNIHGEFKQSPELHMRGYGCQQCCHNAIKDDAIYIKAFNETHGDLYEYGDREEGTANWNIRCRIHGWFAQDIYGHIRGCGCPRCTTRVSKGCKTWLDSLGLPDDSEHREVRGLLGRYIVDGYDSSTNTIYEFQGSFWHGELNHPKFPHDAINPITKTTFGELYDQTLAKKNAFEVAGFNYVEIWESEWN